MRSAWAVAVLPAFSLLLLGGVGAAIAAYDSAAPVDLAINGEALAEALPPLGRQAGVGIRAGENAARRRLYLFASKRPLREVMSQLKQEMACSPGLAFWFKSGSGTIFDEDLASRQARGRAVNKLLSERVARGRAAMKKVRNWVDDMGPFEQAKARQMAKKSKGEVPVITRWEQGRWLAILEALHPEIQERVFLGSEVKIPFNSLSPAVRAACDAAKNGSPYPRRPAKRPRPARSQPRERFTLAISPSPGASSDRPSAGIVLVKEGTSGGAAFPEVLKIPADLGGNPSWRDLPEERSRPRRGPDGMEKLPDLQTLLTAPNWTDGDLVAPRLLPALSRLIGKPLIGEFDPCASSSLLGNGRFPKPALRLLHIWRKPMSAWKVLEEACDQLDLDWDYRDGWIVIKSPRQVQGWAGLIDLRPVPL